MKKYIVKETMIFEVNAEDEDEAFEKYSEYGAYQGSEFDIQEVG